MIFAGFSASAVRDRLTDAQPKVVICTDGTLRRGRPVPLLSTLREAMTGVEGVGAVVVARRVDRDAPLQQGEHDFHALLDAQTRHADPVPVEANEPGFIIYTSGTTSKPKGLVHSAAGFLVGTYANVLWSLNLRPDDVYWCTADVGWLTFPIFALVGGLAHGATLVVYEGGIDHPTPERPYALLERYGVTKMFTAPTALRMLRRAGDARRRPARPHATAARRAGRRAARPGNVALDAGHARRGRIFVNNTYGQTETGTAWASSMVGLTPTRPGSCGEPLPATARRSCGTTGSPPRAANWAS